MTSERVDVHITPGDYAEFSALIEANRQELLLHCYRLMGSFHEAEDLVQETWLRAWQYRETFKGQASLSTWLYRIATNACLDALKKRTPRLLPPIAAHEADPLLPLAPALSESTWLEPFPNSWLALVTEDPAMHYARRESISLAFLTTLQLLPPRQRAILLLSDVLDWHLNEIVDLLSISLSAVKSALRRARVKLAENYSSDEKAGGNIPDVDTATKLLLARYLAAWEAQDIDGLVALMKEDATFTMPPSPSWYRGREAIQTVLALQAFAPEAQNRWYFVLTGANGSPAYAVYHASSPGDAPRAFGIQVVTLEARGTNLQIADVTTFLNPSLFTAFGFPQELTAK